MSERLGHDFSHSSTCALCGCQHKGGAGKTECPSRLRQALDAAEADSAAAFLFIRDYEWGMGTYDEMQARATRLLLDTTTGRRVLGGDISPKPGAAHDP